MIRRNQFLLNLVNAFTDGVIVLVSYLLAAWLWLDVFKAEPNIASIRRLSEGIGAAAVVYSLVMVALLALFRLYNPARSRRIRYDMLAITAANTVGTLSVATILFIFRLQEFSRGVLLLFYLLSLGFLNLKHVILRLTLDTIRTNGYNLKHILVVGTGYLAIQFTEDLKASPNVGFHIVGYIGRHKQISNEEFLGSFEALAPKLEDNTIDEVVIALEADEMTYFQEAISACEKSGTKVSVIPYYNQHHPLLPHDRTDRAEQAYQPAQQSFGQRRLCRHQAHIRHTVQPADPDGAQPRTFVPRRRRQAVQPRSHPVQTAARGARQKELHHAEVPQYARKRR